MMFLVLVCLLLSTRVMAFPPAEAPAVVHFSSLAALAYIQHKLMDSCVCSKVTCCCVPQFNGFKLFIHKFTCLLIYQNIYLFVCLFCVSVYLFIITRHTNSLISFCEFSFMYLILYLQCRGMSLLFFYELVRLDISMPYIFKSFFIDDSLLYYIA